MIAHGLITRRAGAPARDGASAPARQRAERPGRWPGAAASIDLDADEQGLVEARERLAALVWPPRVLRAEQARVWSRATLLELGCGFDRGRVTIPDQGRPRPAARGAAIRAEP